MPRNPSSAARLALAPAAMLLALAACDLTDSSGPQQPLPADQSPGTFRLTLDHDGIQREAVVFVPETYDAQARTPLVLNFHGFGGIAAEHMEWADLRTQAAETGALLVYPQGSDLEGAPHWNPVPAGGDNKSSADDLGFIEVLLDEIAASYPYDARRVSAVGYSNGGMMAMGLACLRSDLVASAGSVSGAMLDGDCAPSHPVSVITLHGTEDPTIPYEGGEGYPSAEETVDYWVEVTGAGDVQSTTLRDGGTTIEYWAHEGGTNGAAVHHYRVDGGDHVWFDFEADGRSANDRIWVFLTAYSTDGRL